MAQKISFLNIKGGVGKTSLLVNMGACLAYMGRRVLIVDFDAQSNASIWLMRLDRWNLLNKTPEKFLLNVFKDPNSKLSACIQKSPIRDTDGDEMLPRLDLAPASFTLMDLEHEVPQIPGKTFYERFYEALGEIEDNYDFILFDCPPNFFYTTQCALFSSDHVLVPSNPDALSIIGFHLLVDKLAKFRSDSAAQRDAAGAPNPEIVGIALNAVKPGTKIHVPLERFNAQIDRFKTQNKVSSKTHIYPQLIRHSVTVGRAVMLGIPTVLMSKQDASINLAEDYIKLTKHLLEQLGDPEKEQEDEEG
ncbi:AAA family ATPase [Pelagicoccus sp. SDUM812005]|uniref:ParA family protein n=1 Tax=Pelagicoccus sp. SDUM812005 TaxID=3041257 RepID=UPI00280D4BE2|nr:AAA family ATPase [Pelagicoccus sp. SDUM812005]MDQ8179227.1 AAA family ATPase [Pelagicoccus sp. SDUM812005]